MTRIFRDVAALAAVSAFSVMVVVWSDAVGYLI